MEQDIDYKKVGCCIKKIRIQKGISQIDLAKIIGVSQTHMSNIENGNTGISLWTAVKISRVLECSIDQFADEDRFKNKTKLKKNHLIDMDDLVEALKLITWKNDKKY